MVSLLISHLLTLVKNTRSFFRPNALKVTHFKPQTFEKVLASKLWCDPNIASSILTLNEGGRGSSTNPTTSNVFTIGTLPQALHRNRYRLEIFSSCLKAFESPYLADAPHRRTARWREHTERVACVDLVCDLAGQAGCTSKVSDSITHSVRNSRGPMPKVCFSSLLNTSYVSFYDWSMAINWFKTITVTKTGFITLSNPKKKDHHSVGFAVCVV